MEVASWVETLRDLMMCDLMGDRMGDLMGGGPVQL